MEFTNEQIAQVAHGANRAYCQSIGDFSQPEWAAAPEWQRDSARKGVEFCRNNPGAPPSSNHDSWLAVKRAEGWTYGPVKNPETKEHPCFVPYEALPADQQVKDVLFKVIVATLAPTAYKTA